MKKRPDVPDALPSAEDLAHVDDGQFSAKLYADLRRVVKRYYGRRGASGCLKRSEVLGMLTMVTFDLQREWERDDRD